MHVASSARIFFTYHRSQDIFFRQVSYAGILVLGIVTPSPVIYNGASLKGAKKNGAREGETRVSLACTFFLTLIYYFSSVCYAG